VLFQGFVDLLRQNIATAAQLLDTQTKQIYKNRGRRSQEEEDGGGGALRIPGLPVVLEEVLEFHLQTVDREGSDIGEELLEEIVRIPRLIE